MNPSGKSYPRSRRDQPEDRSKTDIVKSWFPHLDRADRLALLENLSEGSQWSVNFGVMLGCSVIIAGLGLLQGSVAVIIGAMLVAPLMTPLIGMGLALVQGNFDLLEKAARAMAIGTALSLVLGILLRVLVPGNEVSEQVALRGSPNILDLLVALFAGIAAGYAFVKPKMSGALPGVAISVALVPPLAAAGIAMGCAEWTIAFGALLLYITNFVTIVLGSALVFWLHGIRTPPHRLTTIIHMKRIILGLGIAILILIAPLGFKLMEQIRHGQSRPASLSLSDDLWKALDDRLEQEDGIDFLAGGRASSRGQEDITLVITTNRPVPGKVVTDMDSLIDQMLGRDIEVKFSILQQGILNDLKISEDGILESNKATTVNE